MEGEMKNLIQVWFSIIASLCYCYFISSKIPKGKFRLISLLPVFYLFTILPLHLTYAFPTAITTFFITWLANFKLLLFSFDLGPLSPDPPKSLPLFITVACLPVTNKQRQSPKPTKPTKLPLNLATETVAFSLLMGILNDYRELINPRIVLVLYCCLVFLMVDVLVALSNAAVRALVGLELEPPSDEPYLSTSLQDFWGRRWNLMVTNTLRHTVYKPVRSASKAVFGRQWAPLPAVVAAFLVSGLMHELLFYYVTRASPTWEMTGFFVLHGVCVVVEYGVKRALSGRCRLHWAVSGPLTVGFVVATSFWLFFPPLTRNGADVKVIKEFKISVDFIKKNLILIGIKKGGCGGSGKPQKMRGKSSKSTLGPNPAPLVGSGFGSGFGPLGPNSVGVSPGVRSGLPRRGDISETRKTQTQPERERERLQLYLFSVLVGWVYLLWTYSAHPKLSLSLSLSLNHHHLHVFVPVWKGPQIGIFSFLTDPTYLVSLVLELI